MQYGDTSTPHAPLVKKTVKIVKITAAFYSYYKKIRVKGWLWVCTK